MPTHVCYRRTACPAAPTRGQPSKLLTDEGGGKGYCWESELVALWADHGEPVGRRIPTHSSTSAAPTSLHWPDSCCMRNRLTRTSSRSSNPALTAMVAPIGTAEMPYSF